MASCLQNGLFQKVTQFIKLYLRRDLLDTPGKEVTSLCRENQISHFVWMWLCRDKHSGSATAMKAAIIQRKKANSRERCKMRAGADQQQARRKEQQHAIIWVNDYEETNGHSFVE